MEPICYNANVHYYAHHSGRHHNKLTSRLLFSPSLNPNLNLDEVRIENAAKYDDHDFQMYRVK